MDLRPALVDLTDSERIFVESVLRGMSKTAAAAAAGFKDPAASGKQIAGRPHVAAALEKARQISAQETGITRQKLNDMLMAAYYGAATAGEQIAAVRELAKLNGLYEAQKVAVTHKLEKANNEQELRRLPTEELVRLAQLPANNVIDGEFVEIKQGEHVGRA